MNETLNFHESHLRMLYRLLHHKNGYTRVGSLNISTGVYENKIVKGEDEVIAYAKQYNGTRNIFVSRGVRSQDGSVCSVNAATFDIDPLREKGLASTNEQHRQAILAAQRILSVYPGGYIASSGNGVLLVYSTPNILSNITDYYGRERVLIDELQKLVEEYNVRIDKTCYSEAVVKAIGTMSTKGEHSLRRCSRFIEAPIPPYKSCSKLLERLNSISVSQQTPTQNIDVSSIMSNYKGDRSQADYHLVSYLHRSGVGPADAIALLRTNPLGRKEERPDDQARLISKIYGEIKPKETRSYFERLFIPEENSESAVKTGFDALDKEIGPFPKGELITFAARSGFGKTTFGCSISEFLRNSGRKILYFSTEMSEEYIMHKLVAIACNIPLETMLTRAFTSEQIKRIKEYEQALLQSPMIICDEFKPTLELVKNEINKHRPDLVIFDHINQVSTSWQDTADFMRGLKDLATKEQLPIMVLAQLNEPPRDVKTGEEMHSLRGDIRGSQEIIYLSAIFCFLTNPFQVKGPYQPVEFHVAKNRYGVSGGVVTLTCDKVNSKYIEKENG